MGRILVVGINYSRKTKEHFRKAEMLPSEKALEKTLENAMEP